MARLILQLTKQAATTQYEARCFLWNANLTDKSLQRFPCCRSCRTLLINLRRPPDLRTLEMDQCLTCQQNDQHIILFSVEVKGETTDKGQVKIRDKSKTITDFLKKVNALMNSGGGAVRVHLENPYLLNDLDEQLNDKMQKQIADNSLFHQNFERHFTDACHVFFRLITKTSPLSTYSMNSKLSRDTGVADVTDGQMKRFIRSLRPQNGQAVEEEEGVTEGKARVEEEAATEEEAAIEEECVSENKAVTEENDILQEIKPVEFHGGEEVKIGRGTFQECSRIQAKRVTDISTATEDQFWKTKIAPYISSFSKILSGGSLYLGIKEEATKSSENKEIRTGRFVCEGISLKEEEKIFFKQFIKKNIENQLLTLRLAEEQSENSLVKTKFHPVIYKIPAHTAGRSHRTGAGHDSEGGRFVIELEVRNICGVCFLEDGPEAYEVSRRCEAAEAEYLQQAAEQGAAGSSVTGTGMPRRLSRDDWLHCFCASDKVLGEQMDKLPTLDKMKDKLSFSQ